MPAGKTPVTVTRSKLPVKPNFMPHLIPFENSPGAIS
jgi:hypothetical protein